MAVQCKLRWNTEWQLNQNDSVIEDNRIQYLIIINARSQMSIIIIIIRENY